MLDGVQVELLTVASFAPNSFPGCDIDGDEIAPWDDVKIAPNSAKAVTPTESQEIAPNLPAIDDVVGDGSQTIMDGEKVRGNLPVRGNRPGTIPKTAKNPNWIPCKGIVRSWLGAIERKTIKGQAYYYWRYRSGGKRRSVFLDESWGHALVKLAKLQLNLGNPADRQ